jgi:uncharacterized protein (TIGR00369 family)
MSDDAPKRSRSYDWHDPAPAWERLGKLSGLDYLQAVLRGEVAPPPVAVAMRLRLKEVGEGRVVYAGTPGEDFANDVGTVQGGWIAGLLDAAIGSAVHAALPAGVRYTTLELKVNYVRGVPTNGGELTCEAEVLHVGRRIGTAEARIVDADGKLYAHATTTCLIMPAD